MVKLRKGGLRRPVQKLFIFLLPGIHKWLPETLNPLKEGLGPRVDSTLVLYHRLRSRFFTPNPSEGSSFGDPVVSKGILPRPKRVLLTSGLASGGGMSEFRKPPLWGTEEGIHRFRSDLKFKLQKGEARLGSLPGLFQGDLAPSHTNKSHLNLVQLGLGAQGTSPSVLGFPNPVAGMEMLVQRSFKKLPCFIQC